VHHANGTVRFSGGAKPVHGMTYQFQAALEPVAEHRVVFNNQDSHLIVTETAV
jgi:hypothetical protein